MPRLQPVRSTAYYGQQSPAGSFGFPSRSLFCTVVSLFHTCMVSFSKEKQRLFFFFNLMYTAFGKHQKASHLARLELRFHAVHVAKVQRRVVTTSQKVPCVSPLITEITHHASAILIIRLHKISYPPKSVRREHTS